MTTRVYAYLRASTKEQDANRAKSELQSFADSLSISIAAWFIENESGASDVYKRQDITFQGNREQQQKQSNQSDKMYGGLIPNQVTLSLTLFTTIQHKK